MQMVKTVVQQRSTRSAHQFSEVDALNRRGERKQL